MIVLDLALDAGRRNRGGGRADGFMRFLRILRFRFVDARLVGDFSLAVQPGGDLANLLDRFGRERYRVRAHVGDEADATFVTTYVETFIQLLRQAHGSPRVEAELARGFLLQCGGGERRRRIAATLFPVDGDDAKLAGAVSGRFAVRRSLYGPLDLACLRFVGEAELLHFLAVVFDEFEREGLCCMRAFAVETPILLRNERENFSFALADHA